MARPEQDGALMVSIDVTPAWATIRGLEPTRLNDLIHGAPEPPFRHTARGEAVDYLRSNGANLLYLDEQLPAAQWMDPHNRLFEAKGFRFLSRLRAEQPGDYERDFPFKHPCDPFQLQIFAHARHLREIAMAPAVLGCGKTKMTLDIAADKFLRGEIDGMIIIAPNGVHRQWIREGIPQHMSPKVLVRAHAWKATTKVPKDWPLNPRETVRRL